MSLGNFLRGVATTDGHYYEERMHPSGQTFVVRDGQEIASGLTSDPSYSAHYMDGLGGHDVRNPHEDSGGSIFDALSNFGGSNKKQEQPKKGWFDL